MNAERTMVLTGAAGGIGRATARAFLTTGTRLVLVDREEDSLRQLADDLGDPNRVTTVVADSAAPDSAARIVDAAIAATGRIDDLVLAAGIYPESPVATLSDEEWAMCLHTNLTSAFQLCRQSLPHLRDGASIVGLVSIAGQRGSRYHAHYAASKAGLLAFLRSLALEVAPRVRVNAVAPGTIETHMTATNRARDVDSLLAATPLGRFGTPDEVARVVQFLCTPAAGFITGEVIAVNGGMYMA